MDELSEMGVPVRPRDATGLFPQYEGLVYGAQPGHARAVRAWLDERGCAVRMSWPRAAVQPWPLGGLPGRLPALVSSGSGGRVRCVGAPEAG
jgi:hypothetical protein